MAKYRLKKVDEYVQWTGKNLTEIQSFVGDAKIVCGEVPNILLVTTVVEGLAGYLTLNRGDWIFQINHNEFGFVRAEDFANHYELVSE